jgi:hypothetical protein
MSRVLRSADDQLFLIGGTNDVLRLYDADGFASLVPVEAWRARLAEREAFFARLGIPWCLLLAPEKLSISGDAVLRGGAVTPAARFIERIGHPCACLSARLSSPAARGWLCRLSPHRQPLDRAGRLLRPAMAGPHIGARSRLPRLP